MTDSAEAHRGTADDADLSIACAILTVSDSRTADTDASGDLIETVAREAGHTVVDRQLVADDPVVIADTLAAWLGDVRVQVVLVTGGTGIAPRDGTVEVVRALLTHELEGFGELFRMLSFETIGPAAMLSRAVGGLVAAEPSAGGDTFVFAMPGSRGAVDTAMRRLIMPELAHLVWQRLG